MITFFEGMPRSGKSYSAMKDAIVPALMDGRQVFSNIAGLEHGKIAVLAGISIPRCCELLVQLESSQMATVYQHVENDALIVLDEVQDFWPTGRQKLSPEMTEFITQHGHRGLDIIIMGQAVKDVHALWRRRIERKNYFLKLSALGKPNRYTVTFFNAVLRGEDVVYEQIQSVEYSYDPAYFGTYKSHTAETTNKATLVESRAVVWNTPLFKKWIPIFGIVFVFGLGYMVWFFKGGFADSVIKKPVSADGSQQLTPTRTFPPVAPKVVPPPGPKEDVQKMASLVVQQEPLDAIQELNQRGRVRFLGYVRIGDKIKGFVEWRDSANNLLQSFTLHDLGGFGYVVMVNTTGTVATLTKGPTMITALHWPIDRAIGRTSETDQAKIAGQVDRGGVSALALADMKKPAPPARMPGY